MRVRLRLVFLISLLISVFVFLVFLSYNDGYAISQVFVSSHPIFVVETINITKYIEDVLRRITDPNKKAKEKEFLAEYIKQRNKIITSLPSLTNKTKDTTFHVLVDNTVKVYGRKYDMIILISSNTVNFSRRKHIRELWGNTTTSLNKKWKVFFITGGVGNPKHMKKLHHESSKKKDIVIVDLMENFSVNMGKKVMTALQWANANFDYDYILKCDDDVFTDVDSLLSTLQNTHQKDIYMGNVMRGSEVYRNGRYGVPVEVYPAKYYEAYCSGGGYVLSRSLVDKLIPLFDWEHPIQIDDAYIGGLVIRAGVKAIERNQDFSMWNDACTYRDKLLVTHPAHRECMVKLQKLVLKKRNIQI